MNKLAVSLVCLTLAGIVVGQSWQTGPTAPFPYGRFDGEYFPGTARVYFPGGRLGYSTTSGEVYSYTPATGVYADDSVSMPVPVSNYDVCLLRDNHDVLNGDTFGLYIVGGRRDSYPNYVDSLQVYYPVSNTAVMLSTDQFPGRCDSWITVAQSSIVYDNVIYTVGGFSDSASKTSGQTWSFNPLASAGSRWSQLKDMPLARAYPIVATVDSFLYVCGGDTWSTSMLYPRSECQRLNLNDTSAGWTMVARMPDSNSQVRAFGFNSNDPSGFAGDIIVAGRGMWPYESSNCYIYHTATDTWDTFPRLNQRRRNYAGVFIPAAAGGTGVPGIWVFGGRQDLDTSYLTISEYCGLNIPTHDVGATQILAPRDTVDSGATVTPRAVVHNFGSSGETLDVRLVIGSGYADTVSLTLAPGAIDTAEFADWTALDLGTFAVTCSTMLSGDLDTANDAARGSVFVSPFTGIADRSRLPGVFSLDRVAPCPSVDRAVLRFGVPRQTPATLRIYSAAGTVIRTICSSRLAPGRYSFVWDGRDGNGRIAGAGIYLARFEAGGFTATRKLVLQR
ncbi:MAG TPA: FlgD immunoglobulin-like domain containing protein [bacterium]|nr:FlgD immunoglobulin-like domain containing protein [bacterium]